jgi:hypothetical protein
MSEADSLAAVWWQVWGDGLFRRETARRALLAAYEEAARLAEIAEHHRKREAHEAELAAARASRRAEGDRRMAELEGAGLIAAAGGLQRWVWLQRLSGRRFKDIAADIGCVPGRASKLFYRQARLERELNEARLAAWVRDVWLKYPLSDAAYLETASFERIEHKGLWA